MPTTVKPLYLNSIRVVNAGQFPNLYIYIFFAMLIQLFPEVTMGMDSICSRVK